MRARVILLPGVLRGARREGVWTPFRRSRFMKPRTCDVKHCIDIYKGWIVAFVDGQWRTAHVEPGWVAFAIWSEPNQHLGICREEDLSLAGANDVTELATSPHVLVCGPILDASQLDRIGCVRFGRVETLKPEFYSLKDVAPEVCADLDDTRLDREWPKVPLPVRPRRWTRTARSLVNS